jgi:hypothetical protein
MDKTISFLLNQSFIQKANDLLFTAILILQVVTFTSNKLLGNVWSKVNKMDSFVSKKGDNFFAK